MSPLAPEQLAAEIDTWIAAIEEARENSDVDELEGDDPRLIQLLLQHEVVDNALGVLKHLGSASPRALRMVHWLEGELEDAEVYDEPGLTVVALLVKGRQAIRFADDLARLRQEMRRRTEAKAQAPEAAA
jgi:hypothetical protein